MSNKYEEEFSKNRCVLYTHIHLHIHIHVPHNTECRHVLHVVHTETILQRHKDRLSNINRPISKVQCNRNGDVDVIKGFGPNNSLEMLHM